MRATSLKVNRIKFIDMLNQKRADWVAEYDRRVKAHEDAKVKAETDRADWLVEAKKAVKKKSAEFVKDAELAGSQVINGPEGAWVSLGDPHFPSSSELRITLPAWPRIPVQPDKSLLDQYLRQLDDQVKVLNLASNEELTLDQNLQAWLGTYGPYPI